MNVHTPQQACVWTAHFQQGISMLTEAFLMKMAIQTAQTARNPSEFHETVKNIQSLTAVSCKMGAPWTLWSMCIFNFCVMDNVFMVMQLVFIC